MGGMRTGRGEQQECGCVRGARCGCSGDAGRREVEEQLFNFTFFYYFFFPVS